ncbi:MAG: tRNA pseudouridine(54/55) synthase Pus10 [Candidatus Aenigmatarchaeota archaeon]
MKTFKFNDEVRERVEKILEIGYLCDYCLGRQFKKISTQKSNKERGRMIRKVFSIPNENKICVLCENFFENLPEISKKIISKLKKIEFRTFLLGVRLTDSIVMTEEMFWEKIENEHKESVKSDIHEALRNLIIKKLKRKYEEKKPEITIIFDKGKNDIEISISPLYIYGEYKKYTRGLPQTYSKYHRESVQGIIAKPIMKIAKGSLNVFHAMGREDKEARCLAWRPFVIEIKNPLKRNLNLAKIQREVNKNKKVKIRKLRYSNKEELIKIKIAKPFKIYRLIVEFEKPINNIENVYKIIGTIKQRTPFRFIDVKEDRVRYKKVKNIKWKRINNKKYQFEITAESGIYIKELITGDDGRTTPSIAEVLGCQTFIKEFDLIGLEV